MAYMEQWNVDPALNSAAAPMGAGEQGLAWDRVSDTFRVVMAGIAEVREAIKGGVPTSGLADNSTKFAGRTRQQAYDDYWPLGSERAWASTNGAGITPSGIVATWSLMAADAFLVGASVAGLYPSPGQTVGTNTAATTGAAGGHGHTGTMATAGAHDHTIGSTALTIAQMPEHGHPARISTAAGTSDNNGGFMLDDDNLFNYDPFTGDPTNTAGQQIGGEGGGQGHTHTITSAPAHTHGFTLATVGDHTHDIALPKRYVTAWFRRTA